MPTGGGHWALTLNIQQGVYGCLYACSVWPESLGRLEAELSVTFFLAVGEGREDPGISSA